MKDIATAMPPGWEIDDPDLIARVPVRSGLSLCRWEEGVRVQPSTPVSLEEVRAYCDCLSKWLNRQRK